MCACVRARVCGHSARWETAVFRVEISHGLIIHTTAEEKLAKSEYGHRSSYGFYHWFLVPFCFKTGCVLFLISRIFLQTEKKGKFKLCIEDVYSAVYNYRLLNISQKTSRTTTVALNKNNNNTIGQQLGRLLKSGV